MAQRGMNRGQGMNGSGYAAANNCEYRIPDLTDQQRTQIESMRVKHRKSMMNYRADLRVMEAEIRRMQLSDNVNSAALNDQVDQAFELKAQMTKERLEHKKNIRSLLNNEQKAYFDVYSGRGMGYGKRDCGLNRYGNRGAMGSSRGFRGCRFF
jgi:Spy/CpxP family protein refolding chaperone